MTLKILSALENQQPLAIPCPRGHGKMKYLGITYEDAKTMAHCFCQSCGVFYQTLLTN
ncbi:MAG: hypothetical protein ACFFCQ_12050 [Promethearchaeota archaeon]